MSNKITIEVPNSFTECSISHKSTLFVKDPLTKEHISVHLPDSDKQWFITYFKKNSKFSVVCVEHDLKEPNEGKLCV